jgi:hypothetical protein
VGVAEMTVHGSAIAWCIAAGIEFGNRGPVHVFSGRLHGEF